MNTQMQDAPANPQDSLDLIYKMINTARGNIRTSRFYYLLWGVIVSAAALLHYSLLKYSTFEHPYAAWLLVVPGILLSIGYGIKQGKNQQRRTYFEMVIAGSWGGFFITYVLLLIFMDKVGYQITPLMLLIAGNVAFANALLLRFKPLIFGSMLFWVAGCVAFTLPYEEQLLVMALTPVLGYIIPALTIKGGQS